LSFDDGVAVTTDPEPMSGESPLPATELTEESSRDADSRDAAEQAEALPKDVIFGLLSAERRRRILEYLAEHGDRTTLSDLADHIAALENDADVRMLNSQQRKRVYVALYQCHLPKMDDAEVIAYNQSRGTVQRRPNADQLYRYLAVDPTASTEDDCSGPPESPGVRERVTEFLS
jgi:DNA-binding transcriptional ArsR family regulator